MSRGSTTVSSARRRMHAKFGRSWVVVHQWLFPERQRDITSAASHVTQVEAND
jgi:hypothetical protein